MKHILESVGLLGLAGGFLTMVIVCSCDHDSGLVTDPRSLKYGKMLEDSVGSPLTTGVTETLRGRDRTEFLAFSFENVSDMEGVRDRIETHMPEFEHVDKESYSARVSRILGGVIWNYVENPEILKIAELVKRAIPENLEMYTKKGDGYLVEMILLKESRDRTRILIEELYY